MSATTPRRQRTLVRAPCAALILAVRPATLRRWTLTGVIDSRIDVYDDVVYDVEYLLAFVKPLADEEVPTC